MTNEQSPVSPGDKHPSGHKNQTLLETAIEHHRAGRLDAARTAYLETLRSDTRNATALHMLGVLDYQAGRYNSAIDLITQAEQLAPQDGGLQLNLGNAYQASGQLDDAVNHFNRAIKLMPRFAMAYNNLGNALRMKGDLEQAEHSFNEALSLDDNYVDAWVNLATLHQQQDQQQQMRACLERAVSLDPKHSAARHMLAALTGDKADTAPPEHVARLFDDYAARFDHHLVEKLGYSMPGLLYDEVRRLMGNNSRFRATMDLGCGTGLAGVAFRSMTEYLSGIDLAPAMIEKARSRDVYDALYTGEIITFLENSDTQFDLFICADVFPYIGDVNPLFGAVSSRSNNGALFIFSTEAQTDTDYLLRPTGRFAHSPGYLRAVATRHGFETLTLRTENLRKQKGAWIPGDLVVLRYLGTSG